jgi:hypothetical protein
VRRGTYLESGRRAHRSQGGHADGTDPMLRDARRRQDLLGGVEGAVHGQELARRDARELRHLTGP